MTNLTMVTDEPSVDSRVRSARADVARLRLQIRTVEADIERMRRGADDSQRRGAKDLLRVGLAEMVERRRAELDADLAAVRKQSAQVVAEARAYSATFVAARPEGASLRFAAQPVVAPSIRETPPVVDGEPDLSPAAPAPGAVALTPEYLAHVVHAAVTASFSHLTATPQALNGSHTSSRAPARSRLLHLDVLLPLILVGIVVIVTLAWVS